MMDPELREGPPQANARLHRQFAALCLLIFGSLGIVEMLSRRHPGHAVMFAVAAVVLGLGGLTWPRFIAPVFSVAMSVAVPIGWVTSQLLLAIVFYGVFTPMAFVMRAVGYDGLHRRRSENATYWSPKEQPADPTAYFRQS
jgi:hypothetical protein